MDYLPISVQLPSLFLSLSLSLPDCFLQCRGRPCREMPEIPYTHGHTSIVRGGSWTNTEPLAPHLKIVVCVLFSSVQSLSHVRLFGTPWTAACQASLSITNFWSLPKLMPNESVMPSNCLILCRPLLLLPSIFPSIRVFSNKSALRIRWPKYWSFRFNISPSSEYSRTDFL